MTAAMAERRRLADTLLAVGPDAPTLCHPWATRDLAAHLVVRERRPDAAVGILAKPLAADTDKVQRGLANGSWTDLVDLVRGGPPMWAPTRLAAVDRAVNTVEFFVHHEDVLRAADDWAPRQLDPELTFDLAAALGRAKLLVRKSPVGIVLAPTDGGQTVTAKRGEPSVTVSGPVGELVLWVYGRQAHAVVGYVGDDADVEAVRTARFGI